jgi:TP901 family phage tail tape measure protein
LANDRVVKVSLTAQVSNYLAGMEKARQATAAAGSEAEKAARAVEQQNQAMQSAGRGLLVVGAVAIAATALSVKAAIGWETAWTGVTKTVEGTPAELAKVEEGLRSLAKTLPASHDEIAAVAEAAGQLGIKTASVTAFTKTMIDLGETTNLSADEAATSLARFMNVMGTAQEDVGRLGSAVVELGNNYATTEAEIVMMSQRLSGAGRQIGLSEGEVLGLATALSSVGIEAEAGGSAISKVMIDIASSVDSGGERVAMFAKVAGVSAQEFTQQWEKDPGEALAGFVTGLGEAELQGESTLGILEELGITEVRMRDALLRSAAASDQFSEAMATGNLAFEENNALTLEAAKRYDTVESKLLVMKNRVTDAAISYGEVFLPAVSAAADGIGELANFLGDMDPVMKTVVATVVTLGGVAAITGGIFLLAVPKIAAYQASLQILSLSTMPLVANSAILMQSRIAASAAALGRMSSFMMGPWGVAIVAAAAGLMLLKDAFEEGQPEADRLVVALKQTTSAAEMLRLASKRGDFETFWQGDYLDSLDDIGALMDEITGNGFMDFMTTDFDKTGGIDSLKRYGEAIGTLASTDLPAATAEFKQLVESQELTAEQQGKLLDLMPEYKKKLVEQAEGLDINVSSADEAANKNELLKIALQGVEEPALTAKDAALAAADGYLAAANRAKEMDDNLQGLITSLMEANGVNRDASAANIAYQQSLDDVDAEIQKITEGTEGYARTLDITSQAGRDNRSMLDDLAQANEDAAKAQFELDGDTQRYEQTLIDGNQAVYDRAFAIDGNAASARLLADDIAAVPTKTELEILLDIQKAKDNVVEMERQIKTFTQKWANTPITFDLFLNSSGGDRALAASAARYTAQANAYLGKADGGILPGAPSSVDNMLIRAASGEFVTNAASTADPANRRALEFMNNGGSIQGYANGGFVQPQYVPNGGGSSSTYSTSGDTFNASFQLSAQSGRSVSEQAFEAARRMKIRR